MSSPLSQNAEHILDRFDDAWNDPTPPQIEDFLPPADSSGYLRLLVDLLTIEIEHRLKRGEQPKREEYCQRFPTCADSVSRLIDQARVAGKVTALLAQATENYRNPLTVDAPPVPLSVDQPLRLVGEYELLGPLGSGGMGEVYKARHRRLGKLVALKLLPAGSQLTREIVTRFQREMKAIGTLDHPHVVEAHDSGEQSGVIYIAMKLIDGVDLQRLINERGPLPIDEACELIRQAALGLHYLHQRGFVHWDVKPSNLMRTADGTVKVLDLGLARSCIESEEGHALTATRQLLGTPDFVAPEQVENASNVDVRADLYSLGGTLFYLLTGRVPFSHHKSLFSKLMAHHAEPPPDVHSLRPDVPEVLAAVVQRLLAKKPDERFQTAADVAAALKPFAENAPPEPVSPAGQKTLSRMDAV